MREKITRQDFEPDTSPPSSLRELVLNELSTGVVTDKEGNKHYYPKEAPDIDALMERLYQHIERKALEVYKSNEPWALRSWALANILKDEVASEATVEIADSLVSPIRDWQDDQPFDPIAYYQHRLQKTLRLSRHTVRVYMQTAARFVAKYGRKRHYSDEEVLQYLDWAGEHYSHKQSSYVHECQRLLQFLRNLPNANRQRQLPIKAPTMPTEFDQPIFDDKELEQIAWTCVFDRIRPDLVARIVAASIYGARISELSQLSSDDFRLNGKESSIFIATKKGGDKRRQPIPQSLVPLFSVPIRPVGEANLHNRLRKVVEEKAGIPWRRGLGFHSFRRNVVITLDGLGTQSDLSISKFMRWATPRHLGMLDRYRQTPPEASDQLILQAHPNVALWEYVLPYLLGYNPYYRSIIDISEYPWQITPSV